MCCGWVRICAGSSRCSTPRPNAAVLPLPVLEETIRSAPSSACAAGAPAHDGIDIDGVHASAVEREDGEELDELVSAEDGRRRDDHRRTRVEGEEELQERRIETG